MIRNVRPESQSEQPVKVFKHLLVFAVARLQAAGDQEAVDRIMAELPPLEKGGKHAVE